MITVIFPTRNRADLLALALESLTQQTISQENYEILVIDNGSTDHTVDTAKGFATKLPNLRYFYAPEPGLHVGRHKGMLEAKGDILVYADDDIEALPTWLASIKEAFHDPNVAMVGGNNIPLFLSPPPNWLKKMWNRTVSYKVHAIPPLSILKMSGKPRDFPPHYVWGCNFAIRKQVLLAAGGFHPDGMPKELIQFRGDGETYISRFVAASGKRCVFHPGASVYHKVTPERMTFEYFYQRGFNQGVSDSYTALRAQDLMVTQPKKKIPHRIIGWSRYQLMRLIPTDPEAVHALAEMQRGHCEGYAYHQQMYRDNPEVRFWVHKEKYFEVIK